MDSKVIPLTAKKKKPVLTRLMIVSLIEACVRQKRGIPFGPADIKGGSFGSLIARGFVSVEDVTLRHHTQPLWQVSPQGFGILRQLGVNLDDISLEEETEKGILAHFSN